MCCLSKQWEDSRSVKQAGQGAAAGGSAAPCRPPSVTAVRTCEFPLPVRLGAPGSPSAQRHCSAIWHSCNLCCFQDYPFSPSPDNTRVCLGVSDTILYNFMAPVFMYCPLAARTRHCLPFYIALCQKRKPPLFLHMETTVWDRAVWGTQFDAQFQVFMYLYRVMYFPIMIMFELNFHNLFNDLQHKYHYTQNILYLGLLAVLLIALRKSNSVPNDSFHVS